MTPNLTTIPGRKRRRLRVRWSCCDYCRHEHRWKFTAVICGRIQWFLREVLWLT